MGGELAAKLGEAAFYDLDAPVTRLAARHARAMRPALEREYVPSVERVIEYARRLVKE